MTTVFLSGSRKLGRLNDAIRTRLDNMMSNQLCLLVGDANGADRAMQGYLAAREYRHVVVYYAGDHIRNNVGEWEKRAIAVDDKLRGREFYAQKDKAMARDADFGFVLWDGRSAGSLANVLELLNAERKVVLYFSPAKEFVTIQCIDDLIELVKRCESISRETTSTARPLFDRMLSPLKGIDNRRMNHDRTRP